jgi:hypothetical protein
MTTEEAIKHLVTTLKEDKGYYYGWQANIAMSFYDEYQKQAQERNYIDLGKLDIHEIANKGALRFLDLLCRDNIEEIYIKDKGGNFISVPIGKSGQIITDEKQKDVFGLTHEQERQIIRDMYASNKVRKDIDHQINKNE